WKPLPREEEREVDRIDGEGEGEEEHVEGDERHVAARARGRGEKAQQPFVRPREPSPRVLQLVARGDCPFEERALLGRERVAPRASARRARVRAPREPSREGEEAE